MEDCILNVVSQECSSVEHIIIDGGSTDGTIQIVQKYAERYSHIHWISEKDNGQSEAMNKGVAMSRGKILGFLNVDDFYEPNVLNRVIELFKDMPEPSLLVGNCNMWGENGEFIHLNEPKKLGFNELLLGIDIYPMPVNPSAYFCHKSLHDKIGLYDIKEHYTLDWDFLLRAIQVANAKYIDEIWGNFRLGKGTKTYKGIFAGKQKQRAAEVIKKYRQNLPFLQRIIVHTLGVVLNLPVISSLLYFICKPDELPWRLKARIKRILKLA